MWDSFNLARYLPCESPHVLVRLSFLYGEKYILRCELLDLLDLSSFI